MLRGVADLPFFLSRETTILGSVATDSPSCPNMSQMLMK